MLPETDPRTFEPEPGPLGQIHAWGLYPVWDSALCSGLQYETDLRFSLV